MKLTWYNRPRKFANGVVWGRIVSGRLDGWGIWWADRRSERYDVDECSAPWSPLVVMRLPRFTVAILHPEGDNNPRLKP